MARSLHRHGRGGFIGSNLVAALNARGLTDILVVDHLDHPAKQRNLERVKFRDYLERDEFRSKFLSGNAPGGGQ